MKECNWCKSQVNKDAKVCPNCGKAIWEKKHKKAIKTVGIVFGIIFLLLFIVIIILALNSPSIEEKCQNATEITLKEVQDKMYENHQNANATYNGNYYVLKGKILHIYSKEVQIQDLNSNYSIFVKFSSNYDDEILNLKVGDEIKYCGKLEISSGSYKIDNACILND